jgi:hypothetical protein
MKRFALLVSVLAMTATAYAQDASEFKNSGEFRVRYDNFLNKTATKIGKSEAETTARLKWNLGIRKGENVQAFLSLIHNSTFGTGASRNPSGNSTTNPDYTTAGDENTLIVSRAWGWWKASDMVALKVGRFGIEIADGAVFSEDDYFAFPVTHEGLNVAVDTGFAAINVYAVKVAELTTPATSGQPDPETNRYILSMDFKNMPEAIKMANVHVVQTNTDAVDDATVGSGSANWQHVGLTVGGDAANVLYKGTAAFQMGSFDKTTGNDQKISANMFDLMVGYQLPATMGLKFMLGYHMDTGDDSGTTDKTEKYQSMSYDSHNYAGLMDLISWGNLTDISFGATMMPADDMEVGLGVHMFSLTTDKDTITAGPAWDGGTAPTLKAGEKALGNEIDLHANKSYANDIKAGVRLGMFMPGAAIKDAATTPKQDENIMEAMLQASIGF